MSIFYTIVQSTDQKISFFLCLQVKNEKKRNLYADMIGKGELSRLLVFEAQKSRPSVALDSLMLNRIAISASGSHKILQNLAGEECFFEKKPLIMDLCHSSFKYDVILEGGTYQVRSNLGSFSAIFRGKPHFFIQDQELHFFSKNLSYQWIDKVFPSAWLLSGKSFEKFVEEFEKSPPDGAPEVVWNGCREKRVEILPVLKLCDHTGAFAELYFDYGNEGLVGFHD
ncbi:MAG: hypothetical protein KAR79_05670, partial [Simkaniaceae bacterium]|nr:hypothetical protein [Simkaniaceae bacterium]